MDRGVIVGGGLIAASFLVAVLLNGSAHEEAVPAKAAAPPPVRVCEDTAQRAPGTPSTPDKTEDDCRRPAANPTKP
jgi:hypothetical protein